MRETILDDFQHPLERHGAVAALGEIPNHIPVERDVRPEAYPEAPSVWWGEEALAAEESFDRNGIQPKRY
jgi:hypothetical protein